jgi:uncharacterized protein YjgD (DUF1641 family)
MSQISSTPFLQGSRPRYDSSFLSGTQLADAVQSQPLQVFDVPATGAIQRSSLPNDMLEAFGLVGQVVATAGNVASRERAQEDQAQSGLGSKAFSLDGVDLADDIENGRITLPPGAKPSEFATQFVDSLIETRYADRPEAWKNAYRANAPRVAEALQNKRQRDIERGRATAVDGLKDAAFRAKTPDEVLQAVNSAKALGLSDREAVASVVVPSLKSAALLGDTAAFDRLASQIPEGEFTQTVQLERLRLQSTRANIESASQTNALAMFEEVATSQPPEVAAETLRQMTESGTLSAVNAAKAQQFLADRQNEYVAAAASNALNSLTSGVRSGALNVGDAMRQIDSIEATVGVRAANSMREAMRSALGEQLEAQQQQAENAARNEMLSEYRTQFQSGAAVSTFEDSERQVGKKTVKVGGDDAARILMSQPHLTTTVLSDNERAFYDSVLAFMPSTTTGGRANTLQAFKQAYAARTRPPEEIAQLTRNISDNDVQKAALGVVNKDTWFASLRGEGVQSAPRNIGNLSELQTAIKSEAERLVRAGQASPALAIEQAKNTVSSSGSVINGFWTLTSVEGLPEPVRKELPAIGQQLIDDYKTTNKDIDKAGLSYNRSTGTWEIVDFLGLPVEGPANKTKFRNGDLIRIHNERLQKEADAAELKAVQRNAGMQAERRRVATDPILTDRIQGLLN